ncbi:MAG: hypothetical protein J5850_04715 [Clostridia bacterium]|nr:hypothetical protein [Clostridia bacterium]
MVEVSDYQIIQRNEKGFGKVVFGGDLKEELNDGSEIRARVVNEDDSITVVDWTVCKTEGLHWSVELEIPEGGLYRLEATFCAKNTWAPSFCKHVKIVYHVGVGDIYMTTGQSNMTGFGRDFAYDPPCLGVHELAYNGKWTIATNPLADPTDTIFDFLDIGGASSPALSFARTLKQKLGIPIGIVPVAVGGSPMAEWHPEETARHYKSMLARIPYVGNIKGFIWYQGCFEAMCTPNPVDYFDRFKRMVELWREQFGNLPVITVQLNRWTGGLKVNQDHQWGLVKDAQRRAALEIDGVFAVPSMDLLTSDGIHNSAGSNVVLGERMAAAALAGVYKKGGILAPAVTGAEWIDSRTVLVRITPGHNVWSMDNCGQGFNIEDEDGIAECESAVRVNDGLIVKAVRDCKPNAFFHYAWRTVPEPFVARDVGGMPLLACYRIPVLHSEK